MLTLISSVTALVGLLLFSYGASSIWHAAYFGAHNMTLEAREKLSRKGMRTFYMGVAIMTVSISVVLYAQSGRLGDLMLAPVMVVFVSIYVKYRMKKERE